MTNLLSETRESIVDSGHTADDITFIGSADAKYRMTWAEFERIADVDYDSGYGSAEVATDLIIRFSDGKSMWRREYDGSESWEYDPPGTVDYTQPGLPIERLVGVLWPSLDALHDRSESAYWRPEDVHDVEVNEGYPCATCAAEGSE